jgi:hypothetical protein
MKFRYVRVFGALRTPRRSSPTRRSSSARTSRATTTAQRPRPSSWLRPQIAMRARAQWDGGARRPRWKRARQAGDAASTQLRARRLRVADVAPRGGGREPAADCVSGIPRESFALYSLELEQLAALGAGAQAHVDDLLLPQARRSACARRRAALELRRPIRRLAPESVGNRASA